VVVLTISICAHVTVAPAGVTHIGIAALTHGAMHGIAFSIIQLMVASPSMTTIYARSANWYMNAARTDSTNAARTPRTPTNSRKKALVTRLHTSLNVPMYPNNNSSTKPNSCE
jgi:hypothetical protein